MPRLLKHSPTVGSSLYTIVAKTFLTNLSSSLCASHTLLLDVCHVGLDSLEDLPELLRLEGDDLVVVVDLFDVLNLLPLCLSLCARHLLLEILSLGVFLYHRVDHFVTSSIRVENRTFEAECALAYERVELADLLLVDDLLQGVLEFRDLLVDDL